MLFRSRGLTPARLEIDAAAEVIDLGARPVAVGRRTRDLAVGAGAVGVARRALRTSADYLQERHQFGRPLARFGALQRMLVDAADRVAGASALLHLAAAGTSGAACSQAARTAAEAAVAVADDAIQLHGGYGYTTEYLPERLLRDAVTLRAIAATGRAASSSALGLFDHSLH